MSTSRRQGKLETNPQHGRQVVDTRTGKSLIANALQYVEKDPPPKRYLKPKPGCHRQKRFVPRDSFVNAPTAEELRIQNSRKKPTPMKRLEDSDDEAPPRSNLVVKTIELTPPRRPNLGIAEMKRREAEEARQRATQDAQAPTSGTAVDLITGVRRQEIPKQKLIGVARPSQNFGVPGIGVDIFGRPLLPRASKAELHREEHRMAEQEPGAREHYERLARHVDPTLAPRPKREQPPRVNVMGQPIPDSHGIEDRNPFRKKMFPTDDDPVNLFGGESTPSRNTRSGPLRGTVLRQPPPERGSPFPSGHQPINIFEGGDECPKKPVPHAFPSYITCPPQIVDKRLAGPSPGEAAAQPDVPTTTEKTPGDEMVGTSASYAKKYAGFYRSPLYATIMAACKGWGIRRIRLVLREADKEGSGALSKSQLRNAFFKLGAELDDKQLEHLISLSSSPEKKNKMNLLMIPVFMDILRRGSEIPCVRERIISAAYDVMLKQCQKSDGRLTLNDLEATVDFSAHPTFAPHIRGSFRNVVAQYIALWGPKLTGTSIVTRDMFMAFNYDMSISYPRDSDFMRMMKGMHHS